MSFFEPETPTSSNGATSQWANQYSPFSQGSISQQISGRIRLQNFEEPKTAKVSSRGSNPSRPQHSRNLGDSYRRLALSNHRPRLPNTPSPQQPSPTVDRYKRISDSAEPTPAAFILAVDPEWHPLRGEATIYIFPQDHEQGSCDRISLEEIVAGFYPDSDNGSLDG